MICHCNGLSGLSFLRQPVSFVTNGPVRLLYRVKGDVRDPAKPFIETEREA